MQSVACLTMCLIPILANAAQTDAHAPSYPQPYCVNRSAEFYLYTGEPCKNGRCNGRYSRITVLKAEDVRSTGLKLQNP